MKDPSWAAKPRGITDAHIKYLDMLKNERVINMHDAAPFLQEVFDDLDINAASAYLLYWMKTISDRHPRAIYDTIPNSERFITYSDKELSDAIKQLLIVHQGNDAVSNGLVEELLTRFRVYSPYLQEE